MKDEKIKDGQFHMRTGSDFLATIDDWRAKQRPIVTRSEAIRILVHKALGTNPTRRLNSSSPSQI